MLALRIKGISSSEIEMIGSGKGVWVTSGTSIPHFYQKPPRKY